MKRIKNGCALVIPGSPDTAGHGAAARAKVWAQTFAEFLAKARRLSAPSATNLEQPFIWLARTPTKILWD